MPIICYIFVILDDQREIKKKILILESKKINIRKFLVNFQTGDYKVST